MTKQLILVTSRELIPQDQHFLTFAAAVGVLPKTVSIRHGEVFKNRLLEESRQGTDCLAVSAETLVEVNKTSSAWVETIISGYFGEVLIFGCTHSAEHRNVLSSATGGVVSGTIPLGDQPRRYTFPSASASFTRQLSGLSFSADPLKPGAAFEFRGSTPLPEVILAVNEKPLFARVRLGTSQVFLIAGPLADLNEPLSADQGLEEHYDQLAPVMIFLRHCFGESCWHSAEHTARLIIDDPTLKETYGFLDYNLLSKSMQRSKYGASIAFIPWNYWRTSRQRALRILADSPNLTICMHGCDHTNKEFESQDSELLDMKAALAVERMESHTRRTGIPFEKVMVFPQGRFTRNAIAALRANKYLAVVNTTCSPINSGRDVPRLGDFLNPAVTRYDSFPIFPRRYPLRVFDSAFDLFLGRPALFAAHHDDFREGFARWEGFVAELHETEPALSWPALSDQLMRSCLKRSLANGSVEVRFFTRSFQLVNGEEQTKHFLLSKYEPDPTVVQSVLVDGFPAPFSFDGGFLNLELRVDTGQMRTIEILDHPPLARQSKGFGIVHNSGVLIRRGLSEFRDNTLAKHDGALKIAKLVAKKLKFTGES